MIKNYKDREFLPQRIAYVRSWIVKEHLRHVRRSARIDRTYFAGLTQLRVGPAKTILWR